MTVYDEVWTEFSQSSLILRMPLWEGVGLGLIVCVQDQVILKNIHAVQRRIETRLDIPTVPLDTAHITVRSFGQIVERPQTAHQLAPNRIPAVIDLLTPPLSDIPRFDVHLARVGSFMVCPIAEVHDGGAIWAIRARINPPLADAGFVDFDYGRHGFVPHLTLAYYPQDGDGAEAQSTIAELRDTHLGALHVDRLALVKAEMSEQLCCLETIHEFKLKEKK